MPERNLVFLACSIACLTMLVHTGCSKIPASGWRGFRNNLGQQPPPLPEFDMQREAALRRDRNLAEQAELASRTNRSVPPVVAGSSHAACDHPDCTHSSAKPKLPFAEPIEFPGTNLKQTTDVESREGEGQAVNQQPQDDPNSTQAKSAANTYTLLLNPTQQQRPEPTPNVPSTNLKNSQVSLASFNSTSKRRHDAGVLAVAHAQPMPISVESPANIVVSSPTQTPTRMPTRPLVQLATAPVVTNPVKSSQKVADLPSTRIAHQLDVKPASEFQLANHSSPNLSGTNKSSQLINRMKAQSAPVSPNGTREASTIHVDPTAFDFTSKTVPVPELPPSAKPILKASTQSSIQPSAPSSTQFAPLRSAELFVEASPLRTLSTTATAIPKLESNSSAMKLDNTTTKPAANLQNQFTPHNRFDHQNFVPVSASQLEPKSRQSVNPADIKSQDFFSAPTTQSTTRELPTDFSSPPKSSPTTNFRPIPQSNAPPATMIQPSSAPFQAAMGSAAIAQVSHFEEQIPKPDQQEIDTQELRVANPQFCREIKGFGQIKTFPSTTFENSQRMLIYCEVENHHSPLLPTSAGDRYVTRLAGRYSIMDANGKSVQAGSFPGITDETVRQRRDFYCYFPVTLASLPAGEYRFELKLQDLADEREAQAISSLKFSVR